MDYQQFKEHWFDSNPWIEAHTSGSTGAPKRILLPKADMRASAHATNAFFGVTRNSILAIPLSADYIAGKMMAVRAFEAGCTLFELPNKNVFPLPEKADLISVVPSQAQWLIGNPQWASSCGSVIIGGAPLPMAMQRAMAGAGYDAYCSYGMTETCSHVALQRVTGAPEPFIAMPGIEFSVDDRNCLVISAPAFSFGTLVTNDIVNLIDQRSFMWIGRYDNAINTGGIKVVPEMLEAEISELFSDSVFYVRARDDRKWGQAIEMVVEDCGLTEEEILEKIKNLPDHRLLPKKITIVESIPRTSSGKIKREKAG